MSRHKESTGSIHIILCILTAVIALTVMTIYCMGDDIRADECFSMGFANNSDGYLFMGTGWHEEQNDHGWISGDIIRRYYSVDKGERFNILTAVRRARDDVHPPLYFMILNVACSIYTGDDLAVPGHVINVFFGLIICVMIYMTGRRLFRDERMAFMPVAVWIGTNALESMVTYIRMYEMLCAVSLIYMYLCMIISDKAVTGEKTDDTRHRDFMLYAGAAATTAVGTLTHYYYYIICAMVSLVTLIIVIKAKDTRIVVRFVISQAVGAAISWALYPYVFGHMLHSDRGQQAMGNLKSQDAGFYLEQLKGYAGTFNEELCDGHAVIYLIVLGLISLTAIITVIVKRRGTDRDNGGENARNSGILLKDSALKDLSVMGISSVLYFLCLYKISYSYKWTYISPIFAPAVIVGCTAVIYLLNKSFDRPGIATAAVMAVIICISRLCVSIPVGIDDHIRITDRHSAIESNCKDRDCIFFFDEWSTPHHGQDMELMLFGQIYFVSIDDIYDIDWQKALSYREDTDNALTVYVRNTIPDVAAVAEYISDMTGEETCRYITSDEFSVYNID